MLKLNTLSGFGSGAAGGGVLVTPVYGYVGGGQTDGGYTAAADRLTFSTAVMAAHTDADASAGRETAGGCSDTVAASGFGYITGGHSGTDTTESDRITFSTSVSAAHTDANTSSASSVYTGNSDSTTYGYIPFDAGVGAKQDRLTFSTSVLAAHTDSDISLTRNNMRGCSDPGTYGYLSGGHAPGHGGLRVITDRITFADGVTAAHTDADLSQARQSSRSNTDGVTYGYFCGGWSGGIVTATDRLTFSTSVTAANTDADLTLSASNNKGGMSGESYGYQTGGGTDNVTSERIDFAAGTFATHTDADVHVIKGNQMDISDGRPQ